MQQIYRLSTDKVASLPLSLQQTLSDHDINDKLDFVGFVLSADEHFLLTVFPKHFVKDYHLLTSADIHLLFNVLLQYVLTTHTTAQGATYFEGNSSNMIYPFGAFLGIYDHYQKYGLYYGSCVQDVPRLTGKIDWKKTQAASAKFISDDNVLYLPIFSKIKTTTTVFITECMAYAINYTLKYFGFFFPDFRPVDYPTAQLDFKRQHLKVYQQLLQLYAQIHQDTIKQLVRLLLIFYHGLGHYDVHSLFVINHFDKVWEALVGHYLEFHFDFDKGKITTTVQHNSQHFNFQYAFTPDEGPHHFKLLLDYYYQTPDKQFILDAKYYAEPTSELNYKQVAYHFLLQDQATTTIDTLIFPTSGASHYQDYFVFKTAHNAVIHINAYFLNVREALRFYIK